MNSYIACIIALICFVLIAISMTVWFIFEIKLDTITWNTPEKSITTWFKVTHWSSRILISSIIAALGFSIVGIALDYQEHMAKGEIKLNGWYKKGDMPQELK